jgi:flagellar protein FlaI
VIDLYPVYEPYSFIRVTFNNENSEYRVEPIEPKLDEKETKLLALVKDTLQRTLGYEWEKLTEFDKDKYLSQAVDSFFETRGMHIDVITKKKIGYYIIRDFVGYGVIDSFMRDEGVEDISCDGVNVPIFLFHRKYESIRSELRFETEDLLNSFVVSLAQRSSMVRRLKVTASRRLTRARSPPEAARSPSDVSRKSRSHRST